MDFLERFFIQPDNLIRYAATLLIAFVCSSGILAEDQHDLVQSMLDDFEIIKGRVVDQLMISGATDESIAGIIDRGNDDGSFQGIDYDDLSREAGFPHGRHTRNLLSLARAYKTESSRYYRDDDVKDIIIRGLQYWVEHDFVGDNWHNNQITTPTNLVNLMLVFGDELPSDLTEQAQPMIRRATMERVPGVMYGARPGGDRIAIAAIVAKNCLFLNDREAFDDVIQIIANEIRFTTGERGMQHDFSFHHRHDRVNNTTDYGYGKYANTFGEWAYYVANTEYQFPTERINHLVDYYLDGIYKQLVYGVYRDIGVYNRSITHQKSSSPRGTLEIERLLQSTDYRSRELEDILKLRKGEEANIRSFAKFFWQTEHFVFQRPHFYTSVRMHSTRNKNNEQPYNGPGIVIHHRSDGANYLSLDGHEYDGIWPVYDWQKISGTTIMQKPENHIAARYGGNMPVQKEGLTNFVGGVDNGLYGAVAYDFKSPHDMLEAKKSWFFFDNEYVCLGADINSRPNRPAYTTINQTLLRDDVTVSRDGLVETLPRGRRDMKDVKWLYHDSVGYILPEPATVNISNRAEQGRWSDITARLGASDELVTKDVFLLGINHGNRPSNASYQYIVVPGVTLEELSATSANNRNIEILSNTPEIQAVKHHGLGLIQAVFYKAGEIPLNDELTIGSDSPALIMINKEGGEIEEIAVSDPSRKLDEIRLRVTVKIEGEGTAWNARWKENQGHSVIHFALPEGVNSGKTVRMVKDQGKLAKVAMGDKSISKRRTATESLSDQIILEKIAFGNESWNMRRAAAENITDQSVLRKLFMEDESAEVRYTALSNLTDQSILAHIAMENEDQEARHRAIKRLQDQELLARIAKDDDNAEARLKALKKLVDPDQSILITIANEEKMTEVGYEAIRRVTQEKLRSRLAIENDYAIVPRADFDVTVDGDLSKWKDMPSIKIPSEESEEDISAEIYTAWDDLNFYLAVSVNDDKHFNSSNKEQIWDGDSLQFSLDPLIESIPPFNLGLALASGREQSYQWMGKDTGLLESSVYVVKRDEEKSKTYYEIEIPFECLAITPAEGAILGFNAVVFEDEDGTGFDYWIEMTPGIAGGWNPIKFTRFVLKN